MGKGAPPHIKEDQMLATYFDWVRWMANADPRYKYIIHVPNEGKRSKWGNIWALRKGLSPGVPDVLYLQHPGFAIEAKAEGGTVTPEQREWLNRLRAAGYLCTIARTSEKMIEFTKAFFEVVDNACGKKVQ